MPRPEASHPSLFLRGGGEPRGIGFEHGDDTPGWYDDGRGALRWWDGVQWTEHVAAPDPESEDGEVAPTEAEIVAATEAQAEAERVSAEVDAATALGFGVPPVGTAPEYPAPPRRSRADRAPTPTRTRGSRARAARSRRRPSPASRTSGSCGSYSAFSCSGSSSPRRS
nr:hypothetical protein GCM10025699_17980 [Microbacterium flavescens]